MVAFNIPAFNTDNFSFGPGILLLGAVGATPSGDVGAVNVGAELSITRDILEVRQGSSRGLVKQFARIETVQLTVNGLEWNLERLIDALGSGTFTTESGLETLEFGGDAAIAERALTFKHTLPTGKTIFIDFWKASPRADIATTFGEDLQEFPYIFTALDTTIAWDGSDISDNKRLLRIRRET